MVTREFRGGELVGSWLAAVEEGAIEGRVVQGELWAASFPPGGGWRFMRKRGSR